MKLELFTLCDFAADYGGKLSVVGIFDTLGAKQVPAVHPQCAVAAKMRFEKIEEGPMTTANRRCRRSNVRSR